MRRVIVFASSAVLVLLFSSALLAKTPGIFRGIVLVGPDHEPGWMMVQASNGLVRRVGIERAQVVFAESVPTSDRPKQPHDAIKHGAEVRVTADQDENGEWRATKIEVLKLKGDLPIHPSERSGKLRST